MRAIDGSLSNRTGAQFSLLHVYISMLINESIFVMLSLQDDNAWRVIRVSPNKQVWKNTHVCKFDKSATGM